MGGGKSGQTPRPYFSLEKKKKKRIVSSPDTRLKLTYSGLTRSSARSSQLWLRVHLIFKVHSTVKVVRHSLSQQQGRAVEVVPTDR